MSHSANTAIRGVKPRWLIRDTPPGSVRLAREYPRQDTSLSEEEWELLQLYREEARHELFRRSFLLISERYLKGELPAAGPLP